MSNKQIERNDLIYKVRQEGKSLGEIAKMFGITRERVRQITAKIEEMRRVKGAE